MRSRKDFRFLAASPEEAFQWVSGFADHHCYVNCLPHPMVSSKKPSDFFLEPHVKSKTPPSVLVILNPRSGRGRSSKVFHTKVEPIFKVYISHFFFLANLIIDVLLPFMYHISFLARK